MSIAEAIENAQQKVSNAYSAISSKGGTMPETQNLSNMSSAINSIPALKGETRTVQLSNVNGQTFTPSSGKNAITSITVTPRNYNTTITPTTSSQTINVPSGYCGNGTITVNPVTAAIDSDIKPGNIKIGVDILGVVGTADVATNKFGISTDDLFYTYPNANTTLDNSAPDFEVDNLNISSSYQWASLFKYARIRSFNYNAPSSNAQQNIFSYLLTQNKCVRFCRICLNNINSSYALENHVNNATNLMVHYIDLKGSIKASYLSYMGAVQNTNLYSICFNVTDISGTTSVSNFCYYGSKVKTIWFPTLVSLGETQSSNDQLSLMCYTGCAGIIRFYFPKLKKIGKNGNNNYGTFKQMVSTTASSSPNFTYLYLPALESMHCTNTGIGSGIFSNSGIRAYYLPRFVEATGGGASNLFTNNGLCTELHFGKANQATVEAMAGYATLWGRGAGAATVYFDLINDITCDGVVYTRDQSSDYTLSVEYNGTTYIRDTDSDNSDDTKWHFFSYKSANDEIVKVQNTIVEVTEPVFSYTNTPRWDYNILGNTTAVDVYYAWINGDNVVYTKNQWTPAIGDNYYTKAADGKSMVLAGTISAVA